MATKKKILDLIRKAKTICITTHLNPDADGIGSQLALAMGFKNVFPEKKICCYVEEELPERFKYLDAQNLISKYNVEVNNKQNISWDLFIVVDTNSLERIGKNMRTLAMGASNYIFIDHHPGPKKLLESSHHFINTKACATGEHCAQILHDLSIPLTLNMANCLYTAMLVDTSSFRYPNVTAKSHEILARLLNAGVMPAKAYNDFYGTKSLKHLQLLGRILSKAAVKKTWPFAYICLSDELLSKYNIHYEDTNSFINYLLILHGIEVVGMFRSDAQGLKMSLRSFGKIDVAAMATIFGGGGHNHAAAAFLENKDLSYVPQVVKKLKKYYFSSVII